MAWRPFLESLLQAVHVIALARQARRIMPPPPRTSAGPITGGVLQFQSRHFGNIAVAVPAGRLDQSTAADFEGSLLPLAENAGDAGLIVDFTGVNYLSSMGLRVLMLAAKATHARNARIAAVSLQPIVGEVFAISRFDSVFEMFASLRDALAAMSPEALAAHDAG
jgi:anti-anti-sigma factor